MPNYTKSVLLTDSQKEVVDEAQTALNASQKEDSTKSETVARACEDLINTLEIEVEA